MKLRSRLIAGFSLVEVTLALGIAAFCLIAVFGLVPVGVQTNRNATSQTAATNILSSVVSDLRASPPGQTKSSIYQITRGKSNKWTVCFDGQAKPTGTPMATDRVCPANSNSRYRLYVQIDATSGGVVYPAHAYLRVTWPALASPSVTPSGSVGTVTTFFVAP
jgi:uncharacterized protein (TIGR02598 family)